MRCLLINSPLYRERSSEKEDYLPPLGLGYIATHVKKAGIEVSILDCIKERLGINEILAILQKQQPDFIGINIFTQNYEIVRDIVENLHINASVIIGGQVVKSIFSDILQWNVDNRLLIVIGEGELIIPALINGECCEHPYAVCGKNQVYKVDKNSSYFPSNLSKSFLDRSFFKSYTTINHYGDNEAAIVTSRGCMYNCAFCGGAHDLNNDITIRYRRPDDIESELRDIVSDNPTITSIRVLDDLFLRDMHSIKEACTLFEKFDNLSWRAMAHVLSFTNTYHFLPALRQSGCRELFLGIESGSPAMRARINKLGTVKQVETVVTEILKCGIDVKGYFIYGFPDETLSDAIATYELALRLAKISNTLRGNFRTSVFQFRPYHGTQLYEEILQSGKKIPPIECNSALNIFSGRSQFNFQSGNYSKIEDNVLNNFIVNTQLLTEKTDV